MRKHQKVAHAIRDTWADTVFQGMFTGIAALLCFYSALWMLHDIFPDWQITERTHWIAAALVLFTAAVYGFVIPVIPRYQAVFCLLVPVSYAAAACRLLKPVRIDFEDGACAFVSQYLEKWNKQMSTNWRIWHGKAEWIPFSFSVCALLALLVVLCLALCFGRRIFLLILPVLALAAGLLAGRAPEQKGIALLLAAWIFISACHEPGRYPGADVWRLSMTGRRAGRGKLLTAAVVYGSRPRLYTKLLRVFIPTGAAIFVLSMYFASSILLKVPVSGLMAQASRTYRFQQSVERRISGVAGAFLTPQDVRVNNAAPHYTGKEVMKITASKEPEANLYLKGFCGMDYENGRWTYDDGPFADACARLGYQEQNTAKELLGIPYRLLQTSPNETDKQEVDYTIQYTGLWNRFTYLPYLIDVSSIQNETTFIGDASVQKNWGTRTLHVHGMNCRISFGISEREPMEGIPAVSTFYNEFTEDVYRGWPDQADSTGTDGADYRSYLELLEERVGRNHARFMYAQFIARVLRTNYMYSLDLDAAPEGEDPLDYFLKESGKGYCVHFASAAVQSLREAGIPARYVSGYLVDKEAFHKSDGGYTASVKDEDAHAWAEIYLENIGWVPIEATPSDRERARQSSQTGPGQDTAADMDSQTGAQESDSKEDDEQEETQPEQEPEDEQKEPENQGASEGNGQKNWLDVVRAACIFIAPFLAFAFILVALFRLVCIYRKLPGKEIQKGMYQKAVRRINRRIYRRLRLRGKVRTHDMTDELYEKELKSAYQELSCQDWEHYMKVIKASVFSGSGISRKEACFCYGIYKKIIGMDKNNKIGSL